MKSAGIARPAKPSGKKLPDFVAPSMKEVCHRALKYKALAMISFVSVLSESPTIFFILPFVFLFTQLFMNVAEPVGSSLKFKFFKSLL